MIFFLQSGVSCLISDNEEDKGNDRYSGHSIEVINELAKVANFKHTFLLASDYGKKHLNGSWDGMCHDVISGVRFI